MKVLTYSYHFLLQYAPVVEDITKEGLMFTSCYIRLSQSLMALFMVFAGPKIMLTSLNIALSSLSPPLGVQIWRITFEYTLN